MNRAELMRRLAAHKAAAAACERALKAEAERNYIEQGTADTCRVPDVGTLSVSLTQSATNVVNQDVLLDWLEKNHPDQVVEEVVTVRRVRSQKWLSLMMAEWEPVDPDYVEPGDATSCMDDEGTIIPGVEWRKGGRYLHASVTVDAGLKRQYAAAAVAYVQHGVPMPAVSSSPGLDGRILNGASAG
jgi:hypothetical protein